MRVEVVEQPLGVKRATGSGDGNEYFQCVNHAASARRGQAARENRPRSRPRPRNRRYDYEDDSDFPETA
jgi:hypothetical protein